MRVKFTKDFDYKPTMQTTIGYRAGMEETVKRECGEAAIAAGAAEEVPEQDQKRPAKPAADKPANGAQ